MALGRVARAVAAIEQRPTVDLPAEADAAGGPAAPSATPAHDCAVEEASACAPLPAGLAELLADGFSDEEASIILAVISFDTSAHLDTDEVVFSPSEALPLPPALGLPFR